MTEPRESRYLTTDDPAWLAHAAEFWEERYNAQHRTLHHAEDEIARLRDALTEIADGYERHNPGWWIKKAKAALAGSGQKQGGSDE